MKKLIIFDCDGTLVDSEIIAAQVFPAMWASMGVEMTEEFFIYNFVGTGPDAEIVKQTAARLPANAKEVSEKKFNEELNKNLKSIKGMKELIEKLPHQVCVASNSSYDYILRVLAITELHSFFENRVYSSRQQGRPKPAPDVFLHAAKTLGFEPSECIVIEDSVPGILAAQNAKMTVIGLMAGMHFSPLVREKLLNAKADYYCNDVAELDELILKLSK